jgi:chromosomal replication initiation ATPase DnaA
MDEAKRIDYGPVLNRIRAKLTVPDEQKATQAPKLNLPPGYTHAKWAAVPDCDRLQAMLMRLNNLPHDKSEWPLYIYGRPGTGKTCLAALTYAGYKRQPLWRRADELLIEIGTSRTDGYGSLKAKLEGSPCVFLDDLGVRPPTEAMTQALFDLMELRARRPLVIVSNHTPDALAKIYDERIVSRITAGTTLEIVGQDRRVGQGKRYQTGGSK